MTPEYERLHARNLALLAQASRTVAEDREIERNSLRMDEIEAAINDNTPSRGPRVGHSAAQPLGTAHTTRGPGRISDVRDLSAEQGTAGFDTFGSYLRAVKAANADAVHDRRLTILNAAATTAGSEGIGADGGFAVPPEYRQQIVEAVADEDGVTERVDQFPTSSNSVTVPLDETTPWGTTGIRAFWEAEASAATPTKPNLRTATIKLNKLMALVPVSDELLEDAPLMQTYLPRLIASRIAFARQLAIVQGSGVGQPLGIVSAPATISQAAEASQAAGTFNFANARKMLKRLHGARDRAFWLAHPDHEDSIIGMAFEQRNLAGTENVGGHSLSIAPGGIGAAVEPRLLGLPVVFSHACSAPGAVGDVILCNGAGYWVVTKASGLRMDVSIHMYFDAGQTAFRASLRVAGQPWLSAPIQPRAGTNTRSHFVTLAAR